jgi:hypothetical protein
LQKKIIFFSLARPLQSVPLSPLNPPQGTFGGGAILLFFAFCFLLLFHPLPTSHEGGGVCAGGAFALFSFSFFLHLSCVFAQFCYALSPSPVGWVGVGCGLARKF